MLAAIIPALIPIVDKVFGNLFPDPAAKAKATQDLLTQLVALDLGQLEVNRAEAQSGSFFRGGARPAIMWVCALALAYQYLLMPLGTWGLLIAGITLPVAPPTLDGNLWELMFAMLGMGAMRSFDKLKGKS